MAGEEPDQTKADLVPRFGKFGQSSLAGFLLKLGDAKIDTQVEMWRIQRSLTKVCPRRDAVREEKASFLKVDCFISSLWVLGRRGMRCKGVASGAEGRGQPWGVAGLGARGGIRVWGAGGRGTRTPAPSPPRPLGGRLPAPLGSVEENLAQAAQF